MMAKLLTYIQVPNLHSYPYNINGNSDLTRDTAIKTIHAPQSLAMLTQAQTQLACDEILIFQLFLTSFSLTQEKTTLRNNYTTYSSKLLSKLPFSLTKGQIDTINSLQKKMLSHHTLNILLQGDVGSGKTLVSLFCALLAIENKEQVAFVVPSETLAVQHYNRIQELFDGMPISVALLTGSTKTAARKQILHNLQEGNIHILVGTHALYSKDVHYNTLGFIIIDEQHRFGIEQRNALIKKGTDNNHPPDVLLMSATPIPRSLALTVYGNMDVITLHDRPAMQQTVQTKLINYTRRAEIYHYILAKLKKDEQVFFCTPSN